MFKNLNKSELDLLNSQNISQQDIHFLNENIDIFYKYNKYQDKFNESGKIQDAIDLLKEDFDSIDNSTKTIKSFNSHNYMKLPEEVKQLKFEINFAGVFRGETFVTYYDFFKALNNLNLKDHITTDLKWHYNNVVWTTFKLNVLDICKIHYKEINNYNTFNMLEKMTGCQILESNIIKLNQGILVENKRVLNELDRYIQKDNYSYVQPYLNVMQGFLDQALFHISPITSKSASSIFFVSNRHLAEYCDVSKSKINYTINFFASIGMLIKISDKDIPTKIKKNAKIYSQELSKKTGKGKSNTNLINFYSWVDLTNPKILEKVEQNIEKLRLNKVVVSKIDEKVIRHWLGKAISDEVFRNNSVNVRKSVRNRLANQAFKRYETDWYTFKSNSSNRNISFKEFMECRQ